ncbi:hypothetical protein DQ238_01225 [Geodermatophilus sp. TF02-6]|uniref:hypothetical protein n=1 Tax=Geodermatophilus sp. TF02-6 TaxID=2250575 RepID=UPI000DEB1430|nr:hypothetical protein [Geodermatophilus sp. TF02-6]RBY83728.1 hypothetical protein DQ238_01225 [Geodermatophilus sp. TF02-6]
MTPDETAPAERQLSGGPGIRVGGGSTDERSAARRQPRTVTPADWSAAVARVPLNLAGRTVAGQLLDRAGRSGRVRATPGELAACTCLPVTGIADALADLASRGLIAQEGRTLVLTRPGSAR